MRFKDALNYIEKHGIAMLMAPGSNLQAVAASTKDRGPISEASDFTVTAYVRKKLTSSELDSAGVRPYHEVFAQAVGGTRPPKVDGGIGGTATLKPDRTGRVKGDPRVFKVGRTTGYTEGVITALGGTVVINYGPGKDAYFTGQLVVQATKDNVGPFSRPGDSGSGVLNAKSELVGLLFAGSLVQTLINPIPDVLAALAHELGVAQLNVTTV